MKEIRLVIFNEIYWEKGLIYSQNILPLKHILDGNKTSMKISIYSFTPILFWIIKHKEIINFKKEMKTLGLNVINFPVFFHPTRYLIVRWFLLPFLVVNIAPYLCYLNIVDLFQRKNKTIVYSLRSYQSALSFYLLYFIKATLVFDTRTDWIIENRNIGRWKIDGLTDKMWLSFEKKILDKFHKTIFISEVFRDQVLKRHNMELESKKFPIYYNPIDYNNFRTTLPNGNDFVYTGSLGNWNNIETYLDFFLNISEYFPSSKFYILTSTNLEKIIPVLRNEKYKSIISQVVVKQNIPYNELVNYYQKCSFGLQMMEVADSRVGVKFVEYIAANITPIVNENVQGATYIVNHYKLGVILPLNLTSYKKLAENLIEIRKEQIKLNNRDKLKKLTDINISYKLLEDIYFN